MTEANTEAGGGEKLHSLGLDEELYASLRSIAHYHLRSQRGDITLNCTALVHEAYLKILDSRNTLPDSTRSYSALASIVMRQILVDYVRKKRTAKHGGDLARVTLSHARSADETDYDLLDLDNAMHQLGSRDPYLEELVTLRFFAGMTIDESAAALGRSARSVERDWARARIYLLRALEDSNVAE